MVADLEDALALEAARSGQTTGEATSVLRTLPGSTRRRLRWRLRHPVRWGLAVAVVLAAVAIAVAALAGATHRGAGVTPGIGSHAGLSPVQLASSAANSYNPFGTGPENRDQVGNLVDGDPNTTWSTEEYFGATLKKPGGVGTGVYLDAAPRLLAKAIEIQTPTPGFAVQVYVADRIDLGLAYGDSQPLAARGWLGPVGESSHVRDGQRIALSLHRHAYRYYLVWLTTLPPGRDMATLNELTLFK